MIDKCYVRCILYNTEKRYEDISPADEQRQPLIESVGTKLVYPSQKIY